MTNEKQTSLLRWFSTRMVDEISEEDVKTWRPELHDSFEKLAHGRVLLRTKTGYRLTQIAREEINKRKGQGW